MKGASFLRPRQPLSIVAYVAIFLVIGLVCFGAVAWVAHMQLRTLQHTFAAKAVNAAGLELSAATADLDRSVRRLSASFIAWEETRQQLHNPTYYAYWHDTRVPAANFLPAYFRGVDVYDGTGRPLGIPHDVDMPDNVVAPDAEPALLYKDQVYLRYCDAIPRDYSVPGVMGYLCVKVDFVAGITQSRSFRYLDPATISMAAREVNGLPLGVARGHLHYGVQANRELETFDTLMRSTVVNFVLAGAVLLLLFSYILLFPIGLPLRRLSLYIDALTERRSDAVAYGPAPAFATLEIAKAYRSLDDFYQRLENSAVVLRESEEHFRSLIENSSDVIAIVGDDGTLRYVSPSVLRVLGYEGREWVGHPVREFVHPDDVAAVERALSTVPLEAGSLVLPEFRVRHKQGQWRVLEAVGRQLPTRNRNADIVINTRDVTQGRQAAEVLARARDEALAANRAKSTFLANMSHELRTPLNAVMGYSELLAEELAERGTPDLVGHVNRIHRAGEHLLALINQVLDHSKVESGNMDVMLEEFDIAQLVDNVAETVRPMVAQGDNVLTVICPKTLGRMRSDKLKLQQMLLNLLSNAIKFTRHGQIDLSADRTVADGAAWVVFRVADTGIGIDPSTFPRLFEPFYQGDASTTRQYGGTGLGLAITDQYCRRLGGRVTVESQPGQGATFTLFLPVATTGV